MNPAIGATLVVTLLALAVPMAALIVIFSGVARRWILRTWPERWADETAFDIAGSIRKTPEDWSADRFYLTHKSGLQVWIANDAYGVEVFPDGMYPPTGVRRTKLWRQTYGGDANQQLVWQAYLWWRDNCGAAASAAAAVRFKLAARPYVVA